MNKIEKIVAALNIIEPDHVADDREAFKEKFNKKHGKKILKLKETQKKSFYYYIGKVACWVISISIVFAGANTITGLATGKSICTRIVETWQTMEYTHYKNNKEPSNIQSEDEFQDYKEINTALSFDEIRKSINSKYDFQEPHYIPNEYVAESYITYKFTDSDFSLNRAYLSDSNSIIYCCQYTDYTYQRSLMGTASSERHIQVNDIDAVIFRVKDSLVTMYEDKELVYTISFSDPDIPENEIVKIIESMKGN